MNKPRTIELARYAAVGLVCFAFSTGTLAVLHETLGMNYVAAYVCAFLLTNVLGFVVHGRFTFADAGTTNASPTRYLLVNATLLGLNALVFTMLIDLLGMWYIAASVAVAVLNIPVSFLIHRKLSYGLDSNPKCHTPS